MTSPSSPLLPATHEAATEKTTAAAATPARPPAHLLRSGRALVAAGASALLAAAALYLALGYVPGDRGWQQRRWDNPEFAGPPTLERTVVEPFEKDEPTEPFSAQWSGWIRIEKAGRYNLAVEADDQVTLVVDGTTALDVTGRHGRQVRPTTVQLEPGVHSVVIRLSDLGGGKYLRLFFGLVDGAHGWGPMPFPRRMAWPTQAAAQLGRVGLSEGARTAGLAIALVLATLGVALVACGRRVRRGAPFARADLALVAAVFAVAFVARTFDLPRADVHWDEGSYLHAGMHYVRNAQLGDFAAQSFRWNFEHPPVAKWLYGAAAWAAGPLGGKLFAAFLQALTCVLVFVLGRRYASRLVGASAGLTLALMPYFLAHGRIVGLESPLTFFFTLSALLLMLACERNSWLLHMAWGLTSVLGVFSRATGVWFAPVAAVVCIASLRLQWRRWLPFLASFVGAALAVALAYAAWPWVWSNTAAQLARTYEHWSRFHPSEWVLGTFAVPPVWYYGFAFLAVTPTALLLLALTGLVGGIRRNTLLFVALVFSWLVFPFGQSFASMRQDGARYVIQAFPALALAAGLGIDALTRWLRRPRLGPWLAGATALYLVAACAYVHPYELDFCSEWTGGPAAVIRKRWLEVPFWGEGERELATAINTLAPKGATVHLKLMPSDDFPGLRPDLLTTNDYSADFVVMNFFQFPAEPLGFDRVHEVRVGDGLIGAVYRRKNPEPAPAATPPPAAPAPGNAPAAPTSPAVSP